MKFLALLVLALTPSMLSAAEPNAPNDPQASQPFAPGGFIRLHLSPGGYTITNANADAIQITYTTPHPDELKKVKVNIQTSASSADVSVSDTPHNNFQATIEIPRRSNLRVRMFAGEVVIDGIEGDKDVEVSAGRIEIKVPAPRRIRPPRRLGPRRQHRSLRLQHLQRGSVPLLHPKRRRQIPPPRPRSHRRNRPSRPNLDAPWSDGRPRPSTVRCNLTPPAPRPILPEC